MTFIGILNILRYLNCIPIELEFLYRVYLIFSGVFLTIFIGFMYKNRNNPKVDPIKHLCENYCDC